MLHYIHIYRCAHYCPPSWNFLRYSLASVRSLTGSTVSNSIHMSRQYDKILLGTEQSFISAFTFFNFLKIRLAPFMVHLISSMLDLKSLSQFSSTVLFTGVAMISSIVLPVGLCWTIDFLAQSKL
jgi:hypothetical protein